MKPDSWTDASRGGCCVVVVQILRYLSYRKTIHQHETVKRPKSMPELVVNVCSGYTCLLESEWVLLAKCRTSASIYTSAIVIMKGAAVGH